MGLPGDGGNGDRGRQAGFPDDEGSRVSGVPQGQGNRVRRAPRWWGSGNSGGAPQTRAKRESDGLSRHGLPGDGGSGVSPRSVPVPHGCSSACAPLSPLQVLGDPRRAGAVCGRLELRLGAGAGAGAGPAVPVGPGRWAGLGRARLGCRCWPRSPPTLQRAPRLGPCWPCGSRTPSAADLRTAAARHCPPCPPCRGCLGPSVPTIW